MLTETPLAGPAFPARPCATRHRTRRVDLVTLATARAERPGTAGENSIAAIVTHFAPIVCSTARDPATVASLAAWGARTTLKAGGD